MRYASKFLPPKAWRLPVMLVTAVLAGLLIFLFYISRAYSYLSDDPKTCVNCHIMTPQFATWSHSSHRQYTNCNDCHVPHDNFFNKYLFKAKDGMRHATIFAMRGEPQVIFILEAGKKVVHQNCIRCHSNLLLDPKLVSSVENQRHHATGRVCWECHREVPHGRVNSLSSTPNARVPLPESPVPDWLRKTLEQ
jgi:cytochrome c nitrite reductase small subunit